MAFDYYLIDIMKKTLFIFSSILLLAACQSAAPEVPNVDTAPVDQEDSTDITNDITNTQDESENEILEDEKVEDESSENSTINEPVETSSIEGKISVDTPLMNSKITSPLLVNGEAVGSWFFEASFPIRLLDEEGNELAISPATTSEDWMTTDMVPFEAELNFVPGTATSGKLVLEKDNPSGEPDKAEKLEIPVKF